MKITGDGVRELIRLDPGFGEAMANAINDAEQAKQLMREAGFGCTGQGILETTQLLLRRHETMKQERTLALAEIELFNEADL